MRRRLCNLSVPIYISFAIANGTIVLGGGRNTSGPIGDAKANSERGMGFVVDSCLFSKFVHMVIAGYVIVCSYFLDGDAVLGLFVYIYIYKRVFALRSKIQLF